MRILLCNDDGWQAPGITALADALAATLKEGDELVTVAPDRNCSAASSSLTLQVPLRVNQHRENVYSVTGTPADCVHLALNGVIDYQPDILISGINDGPNLGDDVIYSGTVAAAFEGRGLKLPAVAFSLDYRAEASFDEVAVQAAGLVHVLAGTRLNPGTVLNVNFPACDVSAYRGTRYTRLGSRLPSAPVSAELDPRGNKAYWIGPAGEPHDCVDGTDFHAIENHYISITPLSVDMTDYSELAELHQIRRCS